MTQFPTPDSDRDRDLDRRDPLGFDEVLALLLAFSAIGAILWWSIGRRAESWMSQQGLLGARQTQVAVTPLASPTDAAVSGRVSGIVASPVAQPVAPIPTVSPSEVPQANLGIPRAAVIAAAPAIIATSSPSVTPSVQPTVQPTIQKPVIVVPSVEAQAAAFPDVPNNYWAYPFIAELSQRKLITGLEDGTFKPEDPVNRAQYAALLKGVLKGGQRPEIPFSDVPNSFWGSQAIEQAVTSEFLQGYPDKTFKPEQPISKMQVLLSLASGFDLPKPADPDAALRPLTNRDQIPDWAKPAVGAAAQSDVIVSYPDVQQFQPNQSVTRAEVAAMLYQALKTKGDLPPIQSNYILRP